MKRIVTGLLAMLLVFSCFAFFAKPAKAAVSIVYYEGETYKVYLDGQLGTTDDDKNIKDIEISDEPDHTGEIEIISTEDGTGNESGKVVVTFKAIKVGPVGIKYKKFKAPQYSGTGSWELKLEDEITISPTIYIGQKRTLSVKGVLSDAEENGNIKIDPQKNLSFEIVDMKQNGDFVDVTVIPLTTSAVGGEKAFLYSQYATYNTSWNPQGIHTNLLKQKLTDGQEVSMETGFTYRTGDPGENGAVGYIKEGTLNVIGKDENDKTTFTECKSNGYNAGGVFYLQSTTSTDASVLNLSYVDFIENYHKYGAGAIGVMTGTANVSHAVFDQNASGNPTTQGNGGAIAILSNSKMKIADAEFTDNHATYGGGIYNRGELTLAGVSFDGNTVEASGEGGAICANSSTSITILKGGVELCTATDTFVNYGNVIWDLTDPTSYGSLDGYSLLSLKETSARQTIKVSDQQVPGEYLIARGTEDVLPTEKTSFGLQIMSGTSSSTLPIIVDGNEVKTKLYNYVLKKTANNELVLTVVKNVTLYAKSANKVYDGTPLSANEYTCSDTTYFGTADVLTAVVEGEVTDVGTATNRVVSAKVMRGTKDVSKYFNFTFEDGILTVRSASEDVSVDATTISPILRKYQALQTSDTDVVTIELHTGETVLDADKALIQDETGEKKVQFVTAELFMYVNGANETNIGDENDTIISVTYKFDFTGKMDVSVYRLHDNGTSKNVDELTETANVDGECIVLDETAGTITVKASKYSVFAFAYNDIPETGDQNVSFIYMVLGLVSLAGVGVLLEKKRVF